MADAAGTEEGKPEEKEAALRAGDRGVLSFSEECAGKNVRLTFIRSADGALQAEYQCLQADGTYTEKKNIPLLPAGRMLSDTQSLSFHMPARGPANLHVSGIAALQAFRSRPQEPLFLQGATNLHIEAEEAALLGRIETGLGDGQIHIRVPAGKQPHLQNEGRPGYCSFRYDGRNVTVYTNPAAGVDRVFFNGRPPGEARADGFARPAPLVFDADYGTQFPAPAGAVPAGTGRTGDWSRTDGATQPIYNSLSTANHYLRQKAFRPYFSDSRKKTLIAQVNQAAGVAVLHTDSAGGLVLDERIFGTLSAGQFQAIRTPMKAMFTEVALGTGYHTLRESGFTVAAKGEKIHLTPPPGWTQQHSETLTTYILGLHRLNPKRAEDLWKNIGDSPGAAHDRLALLLNDVYQIPGVHDIHAHHILGNDSTMAKDARLQEVLNNPRDFLAAAQTADGAAAYLQKYHIQEYAVELKKQLKKQVTVAADGTTLLVQAGSAAGAQQLLERLHKARQYAGLDERSFPLEKRHDVIAIPALALRAFDKDKQRKAGQSSFLVVTLSGALDKVRGERNKAYADALQAALGRTTSYYSSSVESLVIGTDDTQQAEALMATIRKATGTDAGTFPITLYEGGKGIEMQAGAIDAYEAEHGHGSFFRRLQAASAAIPAAVTLPHAAPAAAAPAPLPAAAGPPAPPVPNVTPAPPAPPAPNPASARDAGSPANPDPAAGASTPPPRKEKRIPDFLADNMGMGAGGIIGAIIGWFLAAVTGLPSQAGALLGGLFGGGAGAMADGQAGVLSPGGTGSPPSAPPMTEKLQKEVTAYAQLRFTSFQTGEIDRQKVNRFVESYGNRIARNLRPEEQNRRADEIARKTAAIRGAIRDAAGKDAPGMTAAIGQALDVMRSTDREVIRLTDPDALPPIGPPSLHADGVKKAARNL